MSSFLAMGGYGFYVWTAYGIVLTVFALQHVLTRQHHKQQKNLVIKWWQS